MLVLGGVGGAALDVAVASRAAVLVVIYSKTEFNGQN